MSFIMEVGVYEVSLYAAGCWKAAELILAFYRWQRAKGAYLNGERIG